jgi:phosphatidylglycerol:prolipoprotein diacylglycerol transferase
VIFTWPDFSPVLFSIGPFAVHYYALAYITGLLLGWWLARRLCQRAPIAATDLQVDDFLTWAVLGVLVGGRLGYVLFYQSHFESFGHMLTHPIDIIAVWRGGMSSHGGFIGVTVAIIWYSLKNGIDMFRFADRVAVCVPIGLGLGRVANFINGELWGRIADAGSIFPVLVVFPQSGTLAPRYPSELIEALSEGLLLFIIMIIAVQSDKLRAKPGFLAGLFLILYACARIFSECFREPDAFLGFLPFGTTMGQVLSLPVMLGGAYLIWRSLRHRAA